MEGLTKIQATSNTLFSDANGALSQLCASNETLEEFRGDALTQFEAKQDSWRLKK
jgi:hypothetical protein